MGISDNHFDPAFRYESLAREAFGNCNKAGDPWGYAKQEYFHEFIQEPTTSLGKRILTTIFSQLIMTYKDSEILEQLLEQENAVHEALTQTDIIEIIDDTISLIRSQD